MGGRGNRSARGSRPALQRRKRPRARTTSQHSADRRLIVIVASILGVVLITALVAVGIHRTTSGTRAHSQPLSYDTATKSLSFTLPAFAGGSISTAALAGKPAVINFYASWCEVCNAEMPEFEKASRALGGRVGFVGVNPQQGGSDSDSAQAAMVARTGVTYPTVRDADSRLLTQFNTSGALPTTLFLDASGHVIDVHNGGLTLSELQTLIARDLGVNS